MYIGFWKNGLTDADALENTAVGDVSVLFHGFCPTFALALYNTFGYRTYGSYTYDEEIDSDGLVHMFCETPDGILVDVRGMTDDWYAFMEDFSDEFCDLDDDVYVQPTDLSGFEEYPEYDLAISLIQSYPEFYQVS